MLIGYSWLAFRNYLFIAMVEKLYGMPEIEPRIASCKASDLPAVLSLWPHNFKPLCSPKESLCVLAISPPHPYFPSWSHFSTSCHSFAMSEKHWPVLNFCPGGMFWDMVFCDRLSSVSMTWSRFIPRLAGLGVFPWVNKAPLCGFTALYLFIH